MKAALASCHNKLKKELGNLFRKWTPVQEETSQEEEERIKAEFSSRPSPTPTDIADLDNIAEDAEEEELKTNVESSVHEGKKDENVEVGEKLMQLYKVLMMFTVYSYNSHAHLLPPRGPPRAIHGRTYNRAKS